MFILDTNPISILERRGSNAERLLEHLAAVDASAVYVTVISYEEQIRGWTAAISATKNSSAQVIQYTRLLEQLETNCNRAILPCPPVVAASLEDRAPPRWHPVSYQESR